MKTATARKAPLALALVAALLALLTAGVLAPGEAHAQRRIVIDPGHGGTDPGGVGNGLQEKNIVLDVSQRFRSLLIADTQDTGGGGSWTALLTRSNDTFVSLAARASYSNSQGADRFMSIHSNAFTNTTANGTETFSYAEGSTGAALRNLVQAEMIAQWGTTNRGNKTANFAVLRDTAAPAVLHELAFITNAADAAKLGSTTYRQRAAVAHLRAIQRHYGLAPYLPGVAVPVPEGARLVGRVVDERGPVAGALVQLDTGAEQLTDEAGSFAFAGVAVGPRALTASAEGHESRTLDVAVASNATETLEIELVRRPAGGEPDQPADDPNQGGDGDGDGDGEPDGGVAQPELGGCSTGGGGAGGALVLALGAMLALGGRRQRRR